MSKRVVDFLVIERRLEAVGSEYSESVFGISGYYGISSQHSARKIAQHRLLKYNIRIQ